MNIFLHYILSIGIRYRNIRICVIHSICVAIHAKLSATLAIFSKILFIFGNKNSLQTLKAMAFSFSFAKISL